MLFKCQLGNLIISMIQFIYISTISSPQKKQLNILLVDLTQNQKVVKNILNKLEDLMFLFLTLTCLYCILSTILSITD